MDTQRPLAEQPLIDRLFTRMTEMYGHQWLEYVDAAGGQDAATKVWQTGLAGITPEEMRRGIGACLMSGKPWPPALPEFRELCRPPRDAEYEFERAAFILGCQPINWNGDAVLYAAVRDVGAFDVRVRPYIGTMRTRWEKALRRAEEARDLPAPPEPPLGLLAEQPTERGMARSILAGIKAKFFNETGEPHE